jgi:hypothetical protein
LEETQQGNLRLVGKAVHLVEEQGAATGMFDQAHLRLPGIGEGALRVTEQLVFDQAVLHPPHLTGTKGWSRRGLA